MNNDPINEQESFIQLRQLVYAKTLDEGRTDSNLNGLRFYKFSQPTHQHKRQLLMPGIVVVLQGQKTAFLQDQTLTYDELNYLVLATGTVCQGTIVTTRHHKPYLAVHLDLPIELLVKTLAKLSNYVPVVSPSPNQNKNYTESIDINLINALYRLIDTTNSSIECLTIAPLIIEEIIIRLLQSKNGHRIKDLAAISRSSLRIQDSIQFMQEHLTEQLNVYDIASQANMSRSHYIQIFREVTGTTPMRFLRDLRLEKARSLLLYQDMRPNEAAFSSGFETIEHFNREFKRRYSSTPTEYRLSQRKP